MSKRYKITLCAQENRTEVELELSDEELRAIKRVEEALHDAHLEDGSAAIAPWMEVELV